MIFFRLEIFLLTLSLATASYLNVAVDQPGHSISPNLWGIFFEEVNNAGDSGPREGVNFPGNFAGYFVVSANNDEWRMYLDYTNPLNEIQNVSLRLDVNAELTDSNQRIGISNVGFFGIPTRPDYDRYVASFWVKVVGSDFRGPLTVAIESIDERILFTSKQIDRISDQFERYEVVLEPNPDQIQNPSRENKLSISAYGPLPANTSLIFNMVSLFPPTFNNRPNGLRKDLVQILKDAKPSFLRFPGGNFLEGNNIKERFNWEETIGDIVNRPGHVGCWGYYSSDGLGLLEYAQLAEDLNSDMILAIFAGYALNGETTTPEDMGPFIESALNEIEYLIGDVNTTWGARRAADGHEAPFKLRYVEIGNEDFFSSDYDARYPVFYDAITQKYPQLEIIATARTNSRPTPIVDEHYYPGFGWFPDNHRLYDDYPRDGPKIFVGEYATRDNYHPIPEANTAAAMDDAAFMTGIERNSDVVLLASYAPLFGNLENLVWTPAGIYFDQLQSFATPGWWVQHLFSTHRGDIYIPTESDANEGRPNEKIFHVASKRTETNILILKIVNTLDEDIFIDNVVIQGVNSTLGGTITILTGGQWDVNDVENPNRVAPTTRSLDTTSNTFSYNVPAFSLNVFEILLS